MNNFLKFTSILVLTVVLGLGSLTFTSKTFAATYGQTDNDAGSGYNWSSGPWQLVKNSASISGSHRYMAAQSTYDYGWNVPIPLTSRTQSLHIYLDTTQAGNPTAKYYGESAYIGTVNQAIHNRDGFVAVGSMKSSQLTKAPMFLFEIGVNGNGRGKTVADLARIYYVE